MRLSLVLALLGGLLLLVAWRMGGLALLGWWVVGLQRDLQGLLAGRIAALRAGEPHALAALLGLCAGYGFLHAVGPGHGKLLVAAAAVGTRTTARRMAGIAAAGSLAQALAAIVLIYGGMALVGATARATLGASEAWALPAGNAAAAAVGLWLALRGLRAWRATSRARAGHAHSHVPHGHDAHVPAHAVPAHDPHGACGCGRSHGPDPQAAAAAQGLGDMLALVGAMAARPCAGAMMLLAIAWSMGLAAAGAAGALAMGLGAASFTALAALLAVFGRETTLARFGTGRAGSRLLPALQIGAGLLLATSAGALLVGPLLV